MSPRATTQNRQVRRGMYIDGQRATVSPFGGPEHTLRSMVSHAIGDRGEKSFPVRQFAESVVRHVEPKDYLGEILAVRNVFVQRAPAGRMPLFRYTNDPRHVEMIKDPQRMVEEINEYGSTICDCDEIAMMAATMCLTLGREVEFVGLGFSPGKLTHVAARVKEPKSGKWVFVDAVAGPKEREAASRAKHIVFWSLD